jgi:hypothetical protein
VSDSQKLAWLKWILAVKTAFTVLAWGLPALLAPMSIFQLLGVPTPDDPLFVRLFGAVVTAVGLAYWYAYRDPVHNAAILKMGILDNGLVTLTMLVFIVFYGLRSPLMWASGLLTLVFFVSFILLMPRPEPA